MHVLGTLKLALKRGALVTAANWQVVLVQFVADTLFKTLLAVPMVGGVVLVVLLAGGESADLLNLDIGRMISALVAALRAQPLALAGFLAALGLVLASGSVLMFAVKAGSVSVLLAGERHAGALEQPPLRIDAIEQAAAWSIESFVGGMRTLFGRYFQLGIGLAVAYALVAGSYAAVVFRQPGSSAFDWSLVALVASLALILIVTLVNFIYVLAQVVIAAEDCSVLEAVPLVTRLLGRQGVEALGVLASVFALMLLSTAAAIMATAAFGLIAFVPFVGLAALPLQICAWLVRGLVQQYVALTGVGAYLRLHALVLSGAEARVRGYAVDSGAGGQGLKP
jgi:hypothetical protein